jgi:hypothetical protein
MKKYRILGIVNIFFVAFALSACSADKASLLSEACAKVEAAATADRDFQTETPNDLVGDAVSYYSGEPAWKSAADSFDSLASDFAEYLPYAVIVKSEYNSRKDTYADGPTDEDLAKLGGLCGTSIYTR